LGVNSNRFVFNQVSCYPKSRCI